MPSSVTTLVVVVAAASLACISAGQTASGKIQNINTATIMFESMDGPDGQLRAGRNAIYLVSADGTKLRRLSSDGDNILSLPPLPQLSPDGKHIAFVNWIGGIDGGFIAGELYVMNSDGSNHRLLMRVTQTFGQVTQQITGVAWSPDGKTLAVTRLGAGLFLVAADGQADPRLIFQASTRNYSSPAWSSDGKKIALYVFEGNGVSQMSDVYVINADGSGDTQVASTVTQTRFIQRDSPISWSPDSRKVYFALLTSTEHSAVWAIQVSNVDGSGGMQLSDTSLGARSPVASPDGSRIAFTSAQPGQPTEISVMNANGSGIRQLTNDPDWACTNSSWFPDGQRLVLSCHFIKDPCRMAIGCNRRAFVILADNPTPKLTPIIDRDMIHPSAGPSANDP